MTKTNITIGRHPQSDVRIDERWDTVSNQHADISLKGANLIYTDHSSNGTVINGQRIQNTSVGIYPGDKILLANVYELEWPIINKFFPVSQRPTVIRNIRGEEQKPVGRRTVEFTGNQSEKPQQGRMTENFQGRPQTSTATETNDSRPTYEVSNFGQANEYSQSEIDNELEKWNWGGFLCSWLWALFNGIYWPVLILLIAWIPYIGVVCSLCLCVYLGLNGSKMAWRTGRFNSLVKFKKTQKCWTFIGILWFALTIIGNIYLLQYTLSIL